MQFRNDINGLRALAVLPVLFFHAQWSLFSGGFLGVDVFFVISGFLITSLIIKDVSTQSFSLLSFYDRRARRILPALFFTCLISTVLAFIFMLPYDLKNYGQSLLATTLSANNILLYLTSGYWSLAAEFKPLYHTWSLAVEEQYYLLIPLILILLFTVFKHAAKRVSLFVILILLIASFYLSLTSTNKEFNFLMLSHRAWELLAGSACALLLPYMKRPNNILSAVGLVAIISSYSLPNMVSDNQAIYTLTPVIGTMLIILFSSNDSYLGKALSIKPLLFIGSISYSIYLLHMPLLAFLRLLTEGPASFLAQLIAVLGAIPLAYLSWRFIETTFKNRALISHRLFYSLHISAALAFILIGYVLHKTYGLEKLKPEYQNTVSQQHYTDAPNTLIKASFVDKSRTNLLIIGDSFARDLINMLSENDINQHQEIIYQPSLSKALEHNLLNQANTVLISFSKGLTVKVNAQRLRNSSIEVRDFFEELGSKNVYVVGTKNFGYNNNFLRKKFIFEKNSVVKKYRVSPNADPLMANDIEKSVWKKRYIDVFSTLLDKDNKVSLFTPTGHLISYDSNHVTPQGAKYIGQLLLDKTQLGALLNAD